ncbi:MAG: aminoacyl-tRNA hydrolase [Paludibacteraceae bacterium]|nr:aminoacyl-tRNA hydrolase [Paludibacteraceae bacterium]
MKYLIVGLGNIGSEYALTRHNAGFLMVDRLAGSLGASFSSARYGQIATVRIKNQQAVLLKPNTYMNLSGQAVRYWMGKEHIEAERLLVLVDDVALPFGTLRLKPQGSSGGHNGLQNIQDNLGSDRYARLRFGIGNNYHQGGQIDYVLGRFTEQEQQQMDDLLDRTTEIIRSFVLQGVQRTMNQYN